MIDKPKHEGSDNIKARRPRNPNDKAEISVSIRLRRSHQERFEALKSDDSLGKFVGDLVEDFFENQDYRKKFPLLSDPLWSLDFNDYIAAAGNKIDAYQAEKCLIAWLDGTSLPSFTSTGALDDLYKYVVARREDSYEEDAEEIDFVEVSERLLALICDMYYQYKSLHFNVFKILSEVLNQPQCAGMDRSNIIDQLNEIVQLEYIAINHHCISSPSLRFAVYECWRHGKLQKRAERPKWVRFAGSELIAMNVKMVG